MIIIIIVILVLVLGIAMMARICDDDDGSVTAVTTSRLPLANAVVALPRGGTGALVFEGVLAATGTQDQFGGSQVAAGVICCGFDAHLSGGAGLGVVWCGVLVRGFFLGDVENCCNGK